MVLLVLSVPYVLNQSINSVQIKSFPVEALFAGLSPKKSKLLSLGFWPACIVPKLDMSKSKLEVADGAPPIVAKAL